MVHIGGVMRTNIEIDDRLMTEAQRLTGLKTKRETVEILIIITHKPFLCIMRSVGVR
jgi:Arc/MetJ family transcription regulator